MILGLLCAIISSVASVFALGAIFHQQPGYALLLHLVSASAGLMAARCWGSDDRPVGLHETVWAFAVPIVGGPLASLHILGQACTRSENVLDEYSHYLDAKERLGVDATARANLPSVPEPDQLESMADVIFSEASVEDKRLAIETLALMETPRAVGVLRSALSTPSTEVRFYAASVLSSLEERLGNRLAALEQDVTMGRRNDADVEFELARCYFDYAYYGLAEGSRREHFLRQALEHTRRSLRVASHPDAALLEGRALLELNSVAEAERCFVAYIRDHRQDGRGFLWRAEARFRQGKYGGVQHDCKRAMELGLKPPSLAPALELWSAS